MSHPTTADPKAPEQKIGPALRRFIRIAREHGWHVTSAYDGGETHKVERPRAVCDVVFSVDSSSVSFKHEGTGRRGAIYIILEYDQEPTEFINDLSESLEPVWQAWLAYEAKEVL
jgi:hypothetical protein